MSKYKATALGHSPNDGAKGAGTRRLKALIFDVDGTLADTESTHRAAFNQAFSAEGLSWHWDEATYTRLLDISGGKERILHYWHARGDFPHDISGSGVRDTVQRIHDAKTAVYEYAVHSGAVGLRPGVLRLLQEAKAAGLRLAIATTTSPVNIAALLRTAIGPDWVYQFAAIGDASTAPLKKPHPQVYLQMLERLALPAGDCLAFEDSSNGLHAAHAAGLATVITPTRYTASHDFRGCLRLLPDLATVTLAELEDWHGAQPAQPHVQFPAH
ncbi:MAG: HAD-IA family hydrolase [Hydrogenophaga sp.]|uniref:HAD-IA family hydrolase n=1 Tax=Hydrogenophaga sp. TaxID=1904254 RepID=UPI002ABC700B|nr:HAD-IA family hydrolase [Hydrogenophaga sp.]MDZ4283036.1 HAD-IA family hydrolase [Hydrogenophaga sp.]